jgi:citrate lyase subunit beta/citryl-CoA lyase
MTALEAAAGIAAPVRLLLNIETPAALRQAAGLASADPRVAGLQLGFADLFEPLAISRTNQAAVDAALFQARMAAGEAGIFVCDAALADTADGDRYRAEAQRARDFGCIGKSCIHPRQIAIANDVFRPSQGEIAHAMKVVDSIGQASTSGMGAYLVDGHMIDAPFIQRAHAIVAQARALGLLCAADATQAGAQAAGALS